MKRQGDEKWGEKGGGAKKDINESHIKKERNNEMEMREERINKEIKRSVGKYRCEYTGKNKNKEYEVKRESERRIEVKGRLKRYRDTKLKKKGREERVMVKTMKK
jgi:hypothetical protein